MIAATVLGLAAAFLFALSAFMQAARGAVNGDAHSLRNALGVTRLVRNLVRSRIWLAGWMTNLCGVGTQAAALKVGSVATVQPLMSAMSVTNPVASFALGMLAFDTPVPTDPGVVAAIAASLAMIALGVIGLANASNTRRLYHAADDGDTDAALRDVGDTAEPDMRRRAVL